MFHIKLCVCVCFLSFVADKLQLKYECGEVRRKCVSPSPSNNIQRKTIILEWILQQDHDKSKVNISKKQSFFTCWILYILSLCCLFFLMTCKHCILFLFTILCISATSLLTVEWNMSGGRAVAHAWCMNVPVLRELSRGTTFIVNVIHSMCHSWTSVAFPVAIEGVHDGMAETTQLWGHSPTSLE